MPKLTAYGLFLYGAIKLTFVALFSYSLMFATSASAEEEIVCAGKDLLAELEQQNPAAYSELREKAAKIVYGDGRLWKISRPGAEDSWVYGTMHAAEKRIAVLPEPAQLALDNARAVLVEITDNLEPQQAQSIMMRLKHLIFKLDGSTIEADLRAEQILALKAVTQKRMIPYNLAIRMQPWMLSIMVSNQLCDLEAKKQGKALLDASIAVKAKASGKELVALETTEEQFQAISSMSREFQVNALADILKIGSNLDDLKETMKAAYARDDIGIIPPMLEYYSKQFASDNASAEFQQTVIVDRNKRMVERALPQFKRGGVFMAVGALHVPGEEGVAKLLEQEGYTISPVKTGQVF